MKKLRGLLFADPIIILSTVSLGTVSLFISLFDKTGVMQSALARLWARILLSASGVRVEVEGMEHVNPSGSYVFFANHLSYMDTPVALAKISVQFRFLAKKGLFKIPFLGQHLQRAGHVPVPRGDPRGSVRTMIHAAEIIREKKISLLIFPEGGRSRDGVLRDFKEGGAYIAIKAGVPIVPLVMIGTREVLPFGDGIVQSGKVILRILPPLPTSHLTVKDRAEITEQARSLIEAELLNNSPSSPLQPRQSESA